MDSKQTFRVDHIQRPTQRAAVQLLCLAWQEYWDLPTIKRKRRIAREELQTVESTVLVFVPSLANAIHYQSSLRTSITQTSIREARNHIANLKALVT